MDDSMIILILSLVVLGLCSYIIVFFVKKERGIGRQLMNTFFVGITITSWLLFLIETFIYTEPYYRAIDPIESDYSPFSEKHTFTLMVFFALSLIGIYNIWKKGRKIPPLLLIIYLSAIVIQLVVCTQVIVQLSSRHDAYLDASYVRSSDGFLMIIAPVNHIVISVLLIAKVVLEEAKNSAQRSFDNKFLDYLNQKLINSGIISVWTLLILLPFYLLIALIVILFGQEPDSFIKVFTDTTTWHYSQRMHPPYLDHKGHYLCTVAACGNPEIVKPKRLGIRHGKVIIVNRQLMIANAFEAIIQDKFPAMHKFIRSNYDTYGYPLSKKINTPFWANFTYIAMKPIEWFFLLTLYLTAKKPEQLINKQYK